VQLVCTCGFFVISTEPKVSGEIYFNRPLDCARGDCVTALPSTGYARHLRFATLAQDRFHRNVPPSHKATQGRQNTRYDIRNTHVPPSHKATEGRQNTRYDIRNTHVPPSHKATQWQST